MKLQNHYRMELVTIMCSNLRDLVTPELTFQLNELKEHLGIKVFLICELERRKNLIK